MTEALVYIHHLSLTLGGRRILSDINFSILPGSLVTIIGPNGAGKSTLLKAILGLIRPTSGKVIIQPHHRVGYMPQKLKLDGTLPLSVEAFLKLGRQSNISNLNAIVKKVGVEHLLKRSIHVLSGGEMQRVLLARALMDDPHLLILDEPVQGVDIHGQNTIYRLITEVCQRRGCAALIVSHDLHFVMAASDEVICLNEHVCCAGQPLAVQQHPEYRELFGDKPAAPLALYTHHHDHSHEDETHGRHV